MTCPGHWALIEPDDQEVPRDALTQAAADPARPVPVVFNLSSWRQGRLTDWLVGELNDKYEVPTKVDRPWMAHDDLWLLLHGLDEVPAARRASSEAPPALLVPNPCGA